MAARSQGVTPNLLQYEGAWRQRALRRCMDLPCGVRRMIGYAVLYWGLGIIAGLIIACACALWSPASVVSQRAQTIPLVSPPPQFADLLSMETVEFPDGPRPRHVWFGYCIQGFGVDVHALDWYEVATANVGSGVSVSAGWPFRSISTRRVWLESYAKNRDQPRNREWKRGVESPSWIRAVRVYGPDLWFDAKGSGTSAADIGSTHDSRPIPFNVATGSALLNGALYAVLLAALSRSVRTALIWNRVRRGLCTTCSYPLGSTRVCSECGNPAQP